MTASATPPSDKQNLFNCIKCNALIKINFKLDYKFLIQAALNPDIIRISPAPPILLTSLGSVYTGLTALLTHRNGSKTGILIDNENAFAALFEDDARAASAKLSFALRVLMPGNIKTEPLFSNCQLVWRYRNKFVPAGDQVRVLHLLREEGETPLLETSYVTAGSRDGIGAVLALACRDLVEIDLAERPLGPDTIDCKGISVTKFGEFIMKRTTLFLGGSAEDALEQAHTLSEDIVRILCNDLTASDLLDAPLLENWSLATREQQSLIGVVTGHPLIGDGRQAHTSQIFAINLEQGWTKKSRTGSSSLFAKLLTGDADAVVEEPDDDRNAKQSKPPTPCRPNFVDELPKALLLNTLGAALKKRLERGDTLALVLEAPGPDWCAPLAGAFHKMFRGNSFVRDGTSKVKDKNSVGNDEVAVALHFGKPVIGLSQDPTRFLPTALLTAADARLTVRVPNGEFLKRLLSKCIGRPPKEIADSVVSGLSFFEVVAAVRNDTSPAQIIEKWGAASAAKSRAASSVNTPPLHELPGYRGDVLEWGQDLVEDVSLWRGGKMPWRDIASAAVLHGQPGTGKTLFARSLAKSCGLSFVPTSVGDWFANSRGDLGDVILAMRASWDAAIASRPSLYFIDEIDALPNRANLQADRLSWWGPVIDQTLTLLDGATTDRTGIVVLAATNHPQKLDPALVRSGRLDRFLEILPPDAGGLADILAFHLGGDVAAKDLYEISRIARGATGADAASWARQAKRRARTENRSVTTADVINEIAPPDIRSDRDRQLVALHEAGHAVAGFLSDKRLAYVSIVESGQIGGTTLLKRHLPDFPTRSDIEKLAVMILGGRAAEIVFLGGASAGAESDLAQATQFVSSLYTSNGLADSLVHRVWTPDSSSLLEKDPILRRAVHEDLKKLHAQAIKIVKDCEAAVHALADALLKRRFLDGFEAEKIIVAALGGKVEKVTTKRQQAST
eukprot:gene17818-18045_t